MGCNPTGSTSTDPATLIQRLELTIAGDVKALEPAVVGIMTIVTDMRCAAGKDFAIETAKVPSPIIGDRLYAERGRHRDLDAQRLTDPRAAIVVPAVRR